MSFDTLTNEEETVEAENRIIGDQEGFEIKPVVRGFGVIRHLYSLIQPLDALICGGYVRYMASPHREPSPAGDVDVYCKNSDTFEKVSTILQQRGLPKKHENKMAISFDPTDDALLNLSPTIQLIKPVKEGAIVAVGDMENILSNFDFSVIRCGLLSPTEALVDKDFERDEKMKKLRIKNIHCPISSTLRCMKYSRKGYWLRPTEVLKLVQDWEKRDQSYRDEIVNFLTKANSGSGLTQKEVEEMEELMRID